MDAWGTVLSREEPQRPAVVAAVENHSWGLFCPDLSDGPRPLVCPVLPSHSLSLGFARRSLPRACDGPVPWFSCQRGSPGTTAVSPASCPSQCPATGVNGSRMLVQMNVLFLGGGLRSERAELYQGDIY